MRQRKRNQKIVSGMILLLAVLLLGSAGIVKAEEVEEEIRREIKQKGDCYYRGSLDGNEVYIVGIRKGAKNPHIPDRIEGKKVTGIYLYSDLEGMEKNIDTLKIPRYADCPDIRYSETHQPVRVKRYKVSAQNKKCCIRKGCVYSKNGKELLIYPNGKKTKSFMVPEGTEDIDWGAFRDSLVEKVSLPDSVGYIGSGAFSGCSNLKHVKLPSGLKEIEYGTFADSGIRSITIPKSVKKIGERAFKDCKKLRKVTISKGNHLKIIKENAFRRCNRLKAFIWKKPSVHSKKLEIDRNAFRSCIRLEKVELPDTRGILAAQCFYNCRKLKEIEISGFIGGSAFQGCKSLRKVTVKKGTVAIDDWAFEECEKLREIRVASKSKKGYIGKNAFSMEYFDTEFMEEEGEKREEEKRNLTIVAPKGSYAYKYAKKHKKQGLRAKVLK